MEVRIILLITVGCSKKIDVVPEVCYLKVTAVAIFLLEFVASSVQ